MLTSPIFDCHAAAASRACWCARRGEMVTTKLTPRRPRRKYGQRRVGAARSAHDIFAASPAPRLSTISAQHRSSRESSALFRPFECLPSGHTCRACWPDGPIISAHASARSSAFHHLYAATMPRCTSASGRLACSRFSGRRAQHYRCGRRPVTADTAGKFSPFTSAPTTSVDATR